MDIGTGITDAGRCSQILLATGSVSRALPRRTGAGCHWYTTGMSAVCAPPRRDFTLTKKQSEISTHTELEMPFFLGKFIVHTDLDIFQSLGTPQSQRFHFGLTIPIFICEISK
jgi:hypothetical protein